MTFRRLKQYFQQLWRLSRPYIPVVFLCLLAMWPFLTRASLPNNTDAELHVFRLAELSQLVRAGILYPRWAPNFYFGYGYPIFNYYAPLAYYAGLGFELLPLIGPIAAVKGIFLLSILLGGLGTFSFTRLIWGDNAGYAAAALYVYAPYIQYIDPHARGVLAESLSLGLLPCALAALAHLHQHPGRFTFAAAVLFTSLTFLAHNLMAMIFGGVLLGWILWTLLPDWRSFFPRGVLLIALFLGIGLTSFFWLPVGLERNAINLTSVVGEAGSHFSFASHFLTVDELLSITPRHDWGAISPTFTFNLGLIQWVTALLSGLLWVIVQLTVYLGRKPSLPNPYQANFFILSALILLALMLPLSTGVWQTLPLLPFLQFPWRLLGPMALILAVLCGSMIPLLQGYFKNASYLGTVVIALTLLQAAPVAQVLPWGEFGPTDTAALTTQEIRGRWLGTTSTGDFVPVTVDVVPERRGQLLSSLLENQTPDRINYTSIPDNSQIEWQQINPLHIRYDVQGDEPFLLRLYLFDFPGWQVTIDEELVESEIGRPEGFLVIPVPAGNHQIDVVFGSTAARTWGWVLSLLSLVITGLVIWRFKPDKQMSQTNSDANALPVLTSILGLAILLLPSQWLHDQSGGFVKERTDIPLQVNFGDQIMLIGADIDQAVVKPGDSIDVTLYWKAIRPMEINFQSFVHFLAEDGFLKTQDDKLNPGDFPTGQWPLDKYVLDQYELLIPADTLPGSYSINAGLWVSEEGWRLPVIDEGGDSFPLVEIEVR
ncbi:MAG: hypothetical protein QNJ45_25600 [Ardenticatenaceae bacterium]|nr:hypothetical protein [Ardenticatenaceae bacterium]